MEYLSARWPRVRVFALAKNVGFAAAVNRGIEASGGEFVALLNNDTEVDTDWLGQLVAALDRYPDAGSATGKILDFEDRERIGAAGDGMTWYGMPFSRGHGELDIGQFDEPEWIFGATGGGSLYRRSALNSIGLLDEDFFAYLEDVDWAFRAQLAGLRCRYVPSAVMFHIRAATTSKLGELGRFLHERNSIALVLKNYPAVALLKSLPKLGFKALEVMTTAAFDGSLQLVARAWVAGLVAMPRTLRKRRAVQASRRVDRRYLDTIVSADYPGPSTLKQIPQRVISRLRHLFSSSGQ